MSEDRAWAAGFFDGEGCFSLASRGSRAVATISQVDREVLDRFARIVGCGVVYGPHQGNPLTHQQPFYSWRVGSRADFDHVVAVLWPWLGSVKRGAALRVASGASQGGNAQSRKTQCPQGHPYDDENTRWVSPSPGGARTGRQCRACHRTRSNRARQARYSERAA
jgi:hypothetical protein